MQTQITLILEEQSDQCLHLLHLFVAFTSLFGSKSDRNATNFEDVLIFWKIMLPLTMRFPNMSLVVRKPVFGVSDQVPHKPGCTATKDGQRLEILDLGSRGIVTIVLYL